MLNARAEFWLKPFWLKCRLGSGAVGGLSKMALATPLGSSLRCLTFAMVWVFATVLLSMVADNEDSQCGAQTLMRPATSNDCVQLRGSPWPALVVSPGMSTLHCTASSGDVDMVRQPCTPMAEVLSWKRESRAPRNRARFAFKISSSRVNPLAEVIVGIKERQKSVKKESWQEVHQNLVPRTRRNMARVQEMDSKAERTPECEADKSPSGQSVGYSLVNLVDTVLFKLSRSTCNLAAFKHCLAGTRRVLRAMDVPTTLLRDSMPRWRDNDPIWRAMCLLAYFWQDLFSFRSRTKQARSRRVGCARRCGRQRKPGPRKRWKQRLRMRRQIGWRCRRRVWMHPRDRWYSKVYRWIQTSCVVPVWSLLVSKGQHETGRFPEDLFPDSGGVRSRRGGAANEVENKLLQGLEKLLFEVQNGNLSTRTGPESEAQNDLGTDEGLLGALVRLVEKAKKAPGSLLQQLETLILQTKASRENPGIRTSGSKGKGKGKDTFKGKSKDPIPRQGKGKGNTAPPQVLQHEVRGQPPKQRLASHENVKLRPLDWPGYHVVGNPNALGAAIDQADASKPLVLLLRHFEIEETYMLIKGDAGCKISLYILPDNDGNLELPSDVLPGSEVKETVVPVVNPLGKVFSKRVYQWSNFSQTSPLTMRVTVPTEKRPQRQSFEARNKDTLVMRLTMDIRFCGKQAWASATKQAGLTARKRLNHFLSNKAAIVLDTWGWELVSTGKEHVIRGLVRLKTGNHLDSVLAASGRSCEGIRTFVEPLDWTQTPLGQKPYVAWVERLPQESDSDYVTRTAKLATEHGLARGWRQLGLRSKHEPSEVPFRSWTLRNAPIFWSMEDVVQFLEAAEFLKVELVSKQRSRSGVSGGFRAQRKEAQDYFQLLYEGNSFEDEGKFLVVERYRSPAVRQGQVTRLRNETKVSLRHPVAEEVQPHQAAQPPPSSPNGTGSPKGRSVEEKDTILEDGKRQAEGKTGTTPQRKRMRAAPLPEGVQRIPNEGQGNCLFLAVAHGIKRAGGGEHHHRAIRAAALTHLRKHMAKYFLFWDGRDTNGTEMKEQTLEGFKAYVEEVSKNGAWGGNLEVAALAATLDRPITVLHEQGQVYSYNPEGAKKDVFLYYTTHPGHYEALDVQAEAALRLRTKASPGKTAGGKRGGGRTNERVERKGARQNSPEIDSGTDEAVSSLGGHTRASVLGGQTRNSRCGTEEGGGIAETMPRTGLQTEVGSIEDVEDTAETEFRVGPRVDAFTWYCHICESALRADTTAKLSRIRNNHISGYHLHHKRSEFHPIKQGISLIECVPGKLQVGGWMCFGCQKILPPGLPKQVRRASLQAHLAKCTQMSTSANARGVFQLLGGCRLPRNRAPLSMAFANAIATKRYLDDIHTCSPHKVEVVGQFGKWHALVCVECCMFWTGLSACKDSHKRRRQMCSHEERSGNLLRLRTFSVKFPRQAHKQVLDAVGASSAERKVVPKQLQPFDLERLSKETGHSLVFLSSACPRRANNRRRNRFCYTCRSCTVQWGTKKALQKGIRNTTCDEGARKVAVRNKHRFWKRLPQDWASKLMATWKLSSAERKQLRAVQPKRRRREWVRDLTEEGIHPHPGPNCLLSKFSFAFCNSDGLAHAYSVMDECVSRSLHCFGIGEVRLNTQKGTDVKRKLAKQGYRAWLLPCDCRRNAKGKDYCVGGILVAVRNDIRAHKIPGTGRGGCAHGLRSLSCCVPVETARAGC